MKTVPDIKQEPDKKKTNKTRKRCALCNGGLWPIVFLMFQYTCKAKVLVLLSPSALHIKISFTVVHVKHAQGDTCNLNLTKENP